MRMDNFIIYMWYSNSISVPLSQKVTFLHTKKAQSDLKFCGKTGSRFKKKTGSEPVSSVTATFTPTNLRYYRHLFSACTYYLQALITCMYWLPVCTYYLHVHLICSHLLPACTHYMHATNLWYYQLWILLTFTPTNGHPLMLPTFTAINFYAHQPLMLPTFNAKNF